MEAFSNILLQFRMCFRTFVFVILLSHMSVYCQRPEIVDEILPEVKQKNNVGYLNCTVVNKGVESVVQWSKSATVNNGNPIVISEDDKIVYAGNEMQGQNEESGLMKYDVQSRSNGRRLTYMLVVRYLTQEDAGKYLCTIRIQGLNYGEWPTKIGDLTVQIAPQIQTSDNSIYEMDIGGNLQLSCNSHGIPAPNITWKREDGKELPGGGFQSRGSKLNLTNIQMEDRGNYICVADNNVKPPDSFKIKLMVFYPPHCRPVQNSVGQAQNRRFNAKLECIVAGNPQPTMRWEKQTDQGTVLIIDDDKYDIQRQHSMGLKNDDVWYTLLVKNVQAKDYTFYYCVARNRFGENRTQFLLFETMECQGQNCPSIGAGSASHIYLAPITIIFSFMIFKLNRFFNKQ